MNGKYITKRRTIHHEPVKPVEEKSHLEVVKVYENGGKDVIKIIDVKGVKGQPAYDEEVEEQVFVEYTQEEKDAIRIAELKRLLNESDYKAIKFAEGLISAEEYAPIKNERQTYRNEINLLERKYKNGSNN